MLLVEEIADELGIPLSRLYHDRHAALCFLRRILATTTRTGDGARSRWSRPGSRT
ncbi:hypothetical protein [Streptomyces sp. WM6373]|uniref:hypothetical protein n=1 Tax=Streptomyces sp. WM6373 TaxID=1415556 RepID=UPI000A8DD507|nr:hypothetical protein [Streptomyces sp. WM6373]